MGVGSFVRNRTAERLMFSVQASRHCASRHGRYFIGIRMEYGAAWPKKVSSRRRGTLRNFSGLTSLSRRSAVRAHGVAELAQGRGGDRVNRAIGRHWMVRAADDDRSRGAVATVTGWAAALRSHPRITLLRPGAAA